MANRPTSHDPHTADLRADVRDACRILALFGVLNDVAGHVSARASGTQVYLRCRTPDEQGLLFTEDRHVSLLGLSEGAIAPSEDAIVPIEAPLHAAIYEARPDVGAIVHAHPPSSLLCGLTGLDVLPLRANDYLPMRVVLDGVAVLESAAMIDRAERARALVQALGDKQVCLLRGHGIVAVGRTVADATVRAISYENAARMTWRVAASGRDVVAMSDEDRADIDIHSGEGATAATVQNRWAEWNWRYYQRLLTERDAGRAIPLEKGWP